MGSWEQIFKEQGKYFCKPQEDMHNIVKLLKKKKAKRILDLGCGSGRHTILLAEQGFDVYATDISKTGLGILRKELKRKNLRAKLREASCYEKFPFKNNFFDAVISTQVIHHNYHDKIRFCISEIGRVLRLRGIVFVTVPTHKRKMEAKLNVLAHRTYLPLVGEEKGIPHFIYTETMLRKDFKNFKILDLHIEKEGHHWCLLGRLKKASSSLL